MTKLTTKDMGIVRLAQDMWERAEQEYDLPNIEFKFYLTGNRDMKKLSPNKKKHPPSGLVLFDRATYTANVHINREAIKQNFEFVRDDVLPHEIAHVVCCLRPDLGHNHDEGWQQVCKDLGGSGNITYTNECDLRMIKPPVFLYRVNGQLVELSAQRHAALQSKEVQYRMKESGTVITHEHYTGIQR